jgi:hypothetical protein
MTVRPSQACGGSKARPWRLQVVGALDHLRLGDGPKWFGSWQSVADVRLYPLPTRRLLLTAASSSRAGRTARQTADRGTAEIEAYEKAARRSLDAEGRA